jgi:hypothetical protein
VGSNLLALEAANEEEHKVIIGCGFGRLAKEVKPVRGIITNPGFPNGLPRRGKEQPLTVELIRGTSTGYLATSMGAWRGSRSSRREPPLPRATQLDTDQGEAVQRRHCPRRRGAVRRPSGKVRPRVTGAGCCNGGREWIAPTAAHGRRTVSGRRDRDGS